MAAWPHGRMAAWPNNSDDISTFSRPDEVGDCDKQIELPDRMHLSTELVSTACPNLSIQTLDKPLTQI